MRPGRVETMIEYEAVKDRCPVCGSSGALTPCYGDNGQPVPDHDGRPILGVVELQDQDGGR